MRKGQSCICQFWDAIIYGQPGLPGLWHCVKWPEDIASWASAVGRANLTLKLLPLLLPWDFPLTCPVPSHPWPGQHCAAGFLCCSEWGDGKVLRIQWKQDGDVVQGLKVTGCGYYGWWWLFCLWSGRTSLGASWPPCQVRRLGQQGARWSSAIMNFIFSLSVSAWSTLLLFIPILILILKSHVL